MKKLIFIAVFLLMHATLSNAQQMVKWPFNGKEISFT
jgi:hypothetical protein